MIHELKENPEPCEFYPDCWLSGDPNILDPPEYDLVVKLGYLASSDTTEADLIQEF